MFKNSQKYINEIKEEEVLRSVLVFQKYDLVIFNILFFAVISILYLFHFIPKKELH